MSHNDLNDLLLLAITMLLWMKVDSTKQGPPGPPGPPGPMGMTGPEGRPGKDAQ